MGLNAGTGNILFVGAVGAANALGNVTVTSAASVTFNSSFAAASYTQTGSGDATYNGLLNLSGAFSFIGNALTLNGVGTNLVGTTMTVTNAGLFTTANGADLSVGDAMLQNGTGSNSIGGDIASTRDAIGFATGVTLTNGVTMTTGAGAGDDISYGSTVDGLFDLSVIAGNGDVFFDAAVGSIAPLASLTVVSADLTTHFAGNVTTVGDQLFHGAASIDSDVTFTATDTLANITFNGAINNGGILPSNMFVDAGGNVIFNGNIGAVSALGIFSANSGNDLGETITFGEFGSGFFDPTANFEVSAESVQLNTGATSTLAAPATIATIASQSDVGITFNTDDFAMGQNHKLTSYGAIEISGLTGTSATSVTLGDVNAVGDFTVDSGSINLLARSGGQILTNTGGTTNDPMVDVVVGGRVYFSTAPVMIGSGKTAAFSNPTGNVDGSGTLGNFAKTVYPSAITRSLLTGLGGEVLDLSASSVVSYTNQATLLPSPMPILPAIGILGNSDTLDEAKDKEKAKAFEESSTKKTASESNPEPTGIPVASR